MSETKQQLIEDLKALLNEDATEIKEQVEHLKTQFYRGTSDEEAENAEENAALEQQFKELLSQYKAKRAEAAAKNAAEQSANMARKQQILDEMKTLAEGETDSVMSNLQRMRELQAEWNAVGFVPIRDKDKLYKQYREVVDQLYKQFNLQHAEQRLNSFKTTLRVSAEAGANTLARERERLTRAFEIMKSELQTYENNIGFLSASSKKGNSLVAEIQKKADKLKDELDLLRKKIKAVEAEMRREASEQKPE
jgi:uncharacterized coiled-coil protein SlyX